MAVLSRFLAVVVVCMLLVIQDTDAKWPNKFPYIDECRPSVKENCRPNNQKGQCKWSTQQYPVCIDEGFSKQISPLVDIVGKVGSATKFFKFSWGVHLSEGSNQQWIYNVGVEDCARRCLLSAGVEIPGSDANQRIRCLSFDFYPHETPKTGDPWNESIETGMCVLNSENRDTARLRNEDLGYSDAEFFYKSHFSQRPFSDYDGYYEIRDPRGNVFEKLLGYSAKSPELDITTVWGKSRWGVYIFEGPLRKPPVTERMCVIGAGDNERDPVNFFVGFTPISDEQHCTGLQTKQQAIETCESASGYLCSSDLILNHEDNSTYRPLDTMFGKKIGCGYDGQDSEPYGKPYELWAEEDAAFTGTGSNRSPIRKFTRCCGQFTLVAFCDNYRAQNINFCASKTTASDCGLAGTGRTLQLDKGFGNYLDEIRSNCQRNPTTGCSGAVVRDWFVRDQCIWCVQPGYGVSGGAGSCRPGGDYGICPTASQRARNTFAIRSKRLCGGTGVICPLVKTYPDLKWLYDPEPTPPVPKDCAALKLKEECDLFAECGWVVKTKTCARKG